MKRPQARSGNPKARPTGLPSAPARADSASKAAKAAKSTKVTKPQKPERSTKALKVAKSTKTSRPTKAIERRETKRLNLVRKSSSKRGLSAKLSAEAKRFTAYSRRRRAITITVVSAFSSLLLIVLATVVTPVLAVEKITISGTDRIKEESVQKALKSQIGKPLPTVNSAEIASLLEKFPLIESFAIVSLPPHGLKIQITERQPIVIIESGGVKYLYDPAGVRVGKATSKDKYPEMAIAGLPENSKNFAAAIDVLMALPASLLERLASIDAKSKDDVTMRLRGYSGQRIIWGDGSNSVLKSKVLAALIKNQKKNDMVTFDVSSPNAPAVRYGNF